MKKLIYLLVIIPIISCNTNTDKSNEKDQAMKIEYPKTKKVDVVDNYFGTKIHDPYRWLENDTSAETKAWVKAQNKVTFDYLSKIPFRDKIKNRLKQIINYPKVSTPFKSGGLYFYYKNTGLQNQSVLYVTKDYNSEGEIILDPNKLSDDGTVALSTIGVSNDGKYFAYAISKAGSDWQEIFVKNIETKEMLTDHLNWVKFSGIAWYKDGFYYSGYDAPVDGKEYSNKNEYHKLYYHKLGTPQSDDKIIMQNKEFPLRMFYASVSDDEKYLFVYEENVGSRGNKIHLKDFISLLDINKKCEYLTKSST
jgi:prolyl oligopeptidase